MTRDAKVMIPARTSCPPNWTREYYGYLDSENTDTTVNPLSTFVWTTLLYHVRASCVGIDWVPSILYWPGADMYRMYILIIKHCSISNKNISLCGLLELVCWNVFTCYRFVQDRIDRLNIIIICYKSALIIKRIMNLIKYNTYTCTCTSFDTFCANEFAAIR